jgi:hypothetical protein
MTVHHVLAYAGAIVLSAIMMKIFCERSKVDLEHDAEVQAALLFSTRQGLFFIDMAKPCDDWDTRWPEMAAFVSLAR